MFEFLGALGSIILIDLVLSGDNALVIGAAAAGLPKKQRWYAVVLGGGPASGSEWRRGSAGTPARRD